MGGCRFSEKIRLKQKAERDDDWSLGPAIAVPLPLFDWGQQRRARAEAERLEARHRLTQVERTVVEEVRRAHVARNSAQATLQLADTELMPLADERIKQAQAAYANGLADMTTVSLAQQESQRARSTLLTLQHQLVFFICKRFIRPYIVIAVR